MDALLLDELRKGLPTLSRVFGAFLTEAALNCLESHSHESGVIVSVKGNNPNKYKLIWESISDDAMKPGWRDKYEMVEYGATCIAILLCLKKTKFTTVERAMRGTGVDYWVGDPYPNQENKQYIQRKTRLEISGIYNGGNSELNRRVKQKLRQTKQSDDSRLPIFVIVVEFSRPMIGLKEK
jgi:hypothetical protein